MSLECAIARDIWHYARGSQSVCCSTPQSLWSPVAPWWGAKPARSNMEGSLFFCVAGSSDDGDAAPTADVPEYSM